METLWATFLREHMAKEILCLDKFQTFEDKSSALSFETGVNEQLTEMIMSCYSPGQTLAVEKPEYGAIIQTRLGIRCLFDDAVMELMWGLKNLLHCLVPQEKSILTKEYRLPMSKGIVMFLHRYGLVVKPEAVNEQIIFGANILYKCEDIEKDHSLWLQDNGRHLMHVSAINYEDWDVLKLSTALKLICFPQDNVAGDPHEMFSKDELSKLKRDAHKYKGRLSKVACLKSYDTLVHAREAKTAQKKVLESLIKKAEQAYEAEQAKLNS